MREKNNVKPFSLREAKIVDFFPQNSPIPEWLLWQEPQNVDSIICKATFMVDCLLLEAEGNYIILTDPLKPTYAFKFSNGSFINIRVSEKPLHVVTDYSYLK